MSFRGTELGARQLARIRELVDSRQGLSRQALAREVCRAFGWRRANGAWAIRSVVQMLTRLEMRGVLRLPAPRRRQGRPRRAAVERVAALLDAADAPPSAEPLARGLGAALRVRPIRPQELLVWRAHMERHYLGDAALIGESLRYVAELDGQMVDFTY